MRAPYAGGRPREVFSAHHCVLTETNCSLKPPAWGSCAQKHHAEGFFALHPMASSRPPTGRG
eukprot:1474529-Rhodomonas_salina.1